MKSYLKVTRRRRQIDRYRPRGQYPESLYTIRANWADSTEVCRRSFYRKTRLSTIKLIVLRALASNNGVMTPSKIAEWTQTERHNVTTLVGRMRQDGLVMDERNSRDKRFVNITLTDKGREVLMQAMPVAREIVNSVMSLITERDAALLEKRLRVLRQNAHNGLERVAKRSQPQLG